MIRKAKKDFYDNLNVRNITNNKGFWKIVKSFFSNKAGVNGKVTLIEEDKVVSEDNEVAETFESYFETFTENLVINSKYTSEKPASDESVTRN